MNVVCKIYIQQTQCIKGTPPARGQWWGADVRYRSQLVNEASPRGVTSTDDLSSTGVTISAYSSPAE